MKSTGTIVSLALLVLCGCGPAPAAKPSNTPAVTPVPAETPLEIPEQREPVPEAGSSTVEAPVPEAATSELKIERLDWDQTLAIVAANPGKVVVLDLWATYCAPCRKELPGLVALQQKFPDQVVCVSVSLDFDGDRDYPVEAAEVDIRPVLASVKADSIRNVLLTTPATDVYENLKLSSIPAVYVYDQTGQQAATFPQDRKVSAEVTYEGNVSPFVEKLLNE